MKAATTIRVAAFGLLMLAACDACSGGKVTIKAAPKVQWDGGADDAVHACVILGAWGCPAGAGCDASADCACEKMFRADTAAGVGSMFDPQCVIDAGNLDALKACGFTCGALP